jgi:hypothetical protein
MKTIKIPLLGRLALATMMALIVAACNRSATELVPAAGNSGKPAGDSTGTNPGNNKPDGDSTGTNPGKPSDRPSDKTGTKPDDPVGIFKSLKISYASSDFQEIQSDANGKPVQYTSQYLANQGTGQVKRTVYRFQYGSDARLSRVDQTIQTGNNPVSGSYVLYQYEGNKVVRTDEYSTAGNPLASRTYHYSAGNQLVQIDEKNTLSKVELRKTFQYDGLGNLIIFAEFTKGSPEGGFVLETTTSFEGYDHQKHVENLLTTFPFLPNVTFRVNNYHTKIVRYKDGSEISRETVDYAYDANGYPTQKTVNGNGGTLTGKYTY